MTIEQVGYGVITLHCDECVLPPGHPRADDPVTWCDCRPDDGPSMHRPCRNRAHDPDDCPRVPVQDRPPSYDRLSPPEQGPGTEGPGSEPPEPEDEQRPETDGGPFRGPDHDPAGPPDACPFDDTVNLANLRTALDDAATEDRLIALYDAHKPVEDGATDCGTTSAPPARRPPMTALSVPCVVHCPISPTSTRKITVGSRRGQS